MLGVLGILGCGYLLVSEGPERHAVTLAGVQVTERRKEHGVKVWRIAA